MATIVKTIGSGGDYATIALWYAGIQTDNGGSTGLTSITPSVGTYAALGKIIGNIDLSTTGFTTSTSYITDAGHQIGLTGNTAQNYSSGLVYNTANGPSITSADTTRTLDIGQDDFVLSNLQVANTAGGEVARFLNGARQIIDSCILVLISTGVQNLLEFDVNSLPVLRNSLLYVQSGGPAGLLWDRSSDHATVQFCTLAFASDGGSQFQMVQCPQNTVFTDCAFFAGGTTSTFNSSTGTLVLDHNATDFASPPTGTAWQSGLTYANQFKGTTIAGGLDFRAKTGAALLNNGIHISGITTDIAGNARP